MLAHAEKIPELRHEHIIPITIKKLYYALPETERKSVIEDLSKIYDAVGTLKVSYFLDMISKKSEMSPQMRQLFKEILKALKVELNEEIDNSRRKVKDEKLEAIERLNAYKELLKVVSFNASEEYLEMPIVENKFKLKVQGEISNQQKILAVMALNHAINSLPDLLNRLGLPEEQVERYKEKLKQLTFVFVSESEWVEKDYPILAGAYCKIKSGVVYLRFDADINHRNFKSSEDLTKRYSQIIHEVLHILSGGYSNNSNSEVLHETLTETFKRLAVFKELGLPISSTLREQPQESKPSGRYMVLNLLFYSIGFYSSLVKNDEFQELFAVIGRSEWQNAYFSSDFTKVRNAVNNYLSNVPNGFDYLFKDVSSENSFTASLIEPSVDPFRWTEKFDKARKPYKVEK